MVSVEIQNITHPLQSNLVVRICDSFFCRLLGLMFHPPLALDDGLLLIGKKENRIDSAIHMFFMRMDLTVVWLNSDFEVVDLKLAKRWKPVSVPSKPAQHVLEISPKRLNDFVIGDNLKLTKITDD